MRVGGGIGGYGAQVLPREGFRCECRLTRITGKREVYFPSTPAEHLGRTEVPAHDVLDDPGGFRLQHLCKRDRLRSVRKLSCPRKLVEPAEHVGGVRPAIGLTFHEPLHHPERHRLFCRNAVFECACYGGDPRKLDALGELSSDLVVRVDSWLQPAEELQDQAAVVEQGGIALLCREAGRPQFIRTAGLLERGGRLGLNQAAPHRDLLGPF